MTDKNKTVNKRYWEDNIKGFSRFYDKRSEERIIAPSLLAWLYRTFLFPIEKRYMRNRFDIVSQYIEREIRPGMMVADIGCGSGIFLKQMMQRDATVYAIDYAQSSFDLVRSSLSEENEKKVKLMLLDITEEPIPRVDLAISIGVLTYIEKIEAYFNNILPYTDKFLFNYLDARHPLNVLRKRIHMLDVRRLTYHYPSVVRHHIEKRGFRILNVHKLATGYVVEAERAPT